MKYCMECGALADARQKYCKVCGHKFPDAGAPSAFGGGGPARPMGHFPEDEPTELVRPAGRSPEDEPTELVPPPAAWQDGDRTVYVRPDERPQPPGEPQPHGGAALPRKKHPRLRQALLAVLLLLCAAAAGVAVWRFLLPP